MRLRFRLSDIMDEYQARRGKRQSELLEPEQKHNVFAMFLAALIVMLPAILFAVLVLVLLVALIF